MTKPNWTTAIKKKRTPNYQFRKMCSFMSRESCLIGRCKRFWANKLNFRGTEEFLTILEGEQWSVVWNKEKSNSGQEVWGSCVLESSGCGLQTLQYCLLDCLKPALNMGLVTSSGISCIRIKKFSNILLFVPNSHFHFLFWFTLGLIPVVMEKSGLYGTALSSF